MYKLVRIVTEEVKGYKDINLSYTMLSKMENAKNLAIILPGAGYTAQAPLLHYTTGVFLNKNFDVLQINYQYNHKIYQHYSNDQLTKAIKWDVKTILNIVLENSLYENFYLIGKSLGTIAMCSELDRELFKQAKAIWLTPLIHREDVLNSIANSKNEGLCIIGDQDGCYSEEAYSKILENSNITTKLIANVNHSLEYEYETVASIDVMKKVIAVIEKF